MVAVKKCFSKAGFIALAFLASISECVNASPVVDSCFEAETATFILDKNNTVNYISNSGWMVAGRGQFCTGSYWQASNGVRYLCLPGNTIGVCSRSIIDETVLEYLLPPGLAGCPSGGSSVTHYPVFLGSEHYDADCTLAGSDGVEPQLVSTGFPVKEVENSSLIYSTSKNSPFGSQKDVLSNSSTGYKVPSLFFLYLLVVGLIVLFFSAGSLEPEQTPEQRKNRKTDNN